MILTERLLNASISLQTSKGQENLHITGRKKGKKKKKKKRTEKREKGIKMGPALLGESCKRERNLHTGSPPNWQGDQPQQRGSLKALEKSSASGLRRAKKRDRDAQMVSATVQCPQP